MTRNMLYFGRLLSCQNLETLLHRTKKICYLSDVMCVVQDEMSKVRLFYSSIMNLTFLQGILSGTRQPQVQTSFMWRSYILTLFHTFTCNSQSKTIKRHKYYSRKFCGNTSHFHSFKHTVRRMF